MLLLIGLALGALAVGWLVGRPWALLATIVMPFVMVVYRITYEHDHGTPPETWTVVTVIYTLGFALCIFIGIGLRLLTGPAHLRRS